MSSLSHHDSRVRKEESLKEGIGAAFQFAFTFKN